MLHALRRKIGLLIFQYPRVFKYQFLSSCQNVNGKFKGKYPVLLNGKGKINIGENSYMGYRNSPNFFNSYSYIESRSRYGVVKIGDNVHINNNCTIISNHHKIHIDDNCLIGHNCELIDNDGHSITAKDRKFGVPNGADIHIKENSFIGAHVKILKGVTIGKNAIIGSGSVVTKSIPDNSIAAGVPAKVIGKL